MLRVHGIDVMASAAVETPVLSRWSDSSSSNNGNNGTVRQAPQPGGPSHLSADASPPPQVVDDKAAASPAPAAWSAGVTGAGPFLSAGCALANAAELSGTDPALLAGADTGLLTGPSAGLLARLGCCCCCCCWNSEAGVSGLVVAAGNQEWASLSPRLGRHRCASPSTATAPCTGRLGVWPCLQERPSPLFLREAALKIHMHMHTHMLADPTCEGALPSQGLATKAENVNHAHLLLLRPA